MKLSRNFMLMSSLVFMIVLVVSGCGGTEKTSESQKGSQEEVFELNMNLIVSESHHMVQNAVHPWGELVEEKTDGRVKINYYYSSTLGNVTTIWQDVNNGVYEMGVALPSYQVDTELFPLTIGTLPFAFSDAITAANVTAQFNEKYGNFYDNAVYMSMISTDVMSLASTKPIRTVDDIKGLNVGVAGAIGGAVVKAWGGTPVQIPTHESYQALQTGVIDGLTANPTGALTTLKTYEVAPYMSKLGLQAPIGVFLMNKAFYNKLPDDLQTILDELNPKLGEMVTAAYQNEADNAYDQWTELTGNEIIVISEDDLPRFTEVSQSIWEDWVEDATERGYPGEEMMEDFKAMIKGEGLELPF